MALPSFPINNTEDSVAIFDSNSNHLFPEAKIIKAELKETAKLMTHPLETGSEITDHIVIQPVGIDIDVHVIAPNYKNSYNVIKNLYTNATKLIVQTNTSTYKDQLISEMPHSESSDKIDGTVIHLKLVEALFITPQYGTVPIRPKVPKNSSTNDLGVKNGQPSQLESEWHKQNRLSS